jgi:hypothetical protein
MTHDGMHAAGDDRPDTELDDALLAEMRRGYNPPPEPPLDAMWGRIEQDRLGARRAGVHRPPASERARVSRWVGMLAVLLVGVGVGRISVHAQAGEKVEPNKLLTMLKSTETATPRAISQLPPCENAQPKPAVHQTIHE